MEVINMRCAWVHVDCESFSVTLGTAVRGPRIMDSAHKIFKNGSFVIKLGMIVEWVEICHMESFRVIHHHQERRNDVIDVWWRHQQPIFKKTIKSNLQCILGQNDDYSDQSRILITWNRIWYSMGHIPRFLFAAVPRATIVVLVSRLNFTNYL